MTFKEIADTLGVTEASVRASYSNAMRKLRALAGTDEMKELRRIMREAGAC